MLSDERIAQLWQRYSTKPAHGDVYMSRLRFSDAVKIAIAEAVAPYKEENEALKHALISISNLAHDYSSGPEAPDILWEIRNTAYDAANSVNRDYIAQIKRETIERCAKVCDELADALLPLGDWDSIRCADRSDGAKICAQKIRGLLNEKSI